MNNFRKTAAVKVISWILIATLSLSSFSELAYAADISPAEKVISEDEVTEENITEKSESTTTYYLGEGKNMTVWHGGQVRFEDEDGNLTDYEP
ncbi:MAG: hypothetical protein U0K95_03565, partial [Eubacterium sp.]|nr:hypothetical protein [Eubacterium sp.]